jgi:MFS family permease
LIDRRAIVTLYAAGAVQGLALVTFPAASSVFTDAAGYALSSTEYGGMFVPQAILAVGSSLSGAALTRRFGTKRIYLMGLVANLLAMVLLALSKLVMREHTLAYGCLLSATACMGVGFGCTVPALNTFAAAYFPRQADKALLWLNALLGLGTVLAPALIALFVRFGIWWGLPILVGTLIAGLLLFSAPQKLDAGDSSRAAPHGKTAAGLPARFWLFAAFAFFYGVCETMNGNWAPLYITKHFDASATLAALSLTLFWGAVTAGRILFAAIERWFPERRVYRLLPLVIASAFVSCAVLPKADPILGIVALAVAGLGCSALLPLTISFAQKEFTIMSASIASGLIAFYQIGYGAAAFGVGPLQTAAGLDLGRIYGGTSVVALAMAGLAILVIR